MNSVMSVVSDSSFYIAFLSPEEINEPDVLLEILQKYDFLIGKVVLEEISKKNEEKLERINFRKHISILDGYDYGALLSVIGYKIFEKGEYESIAIAYMLLGKSMLHSLIIDDKSAQGWINRNLPELYSFVRYSLRFLVNSCCNDRSMARKTIQNVLRNVELSIHRGYRPFNLSEDNMWMIKELMTEVDEC